MEILAIETSAPRGSVALWRDGAVIGEREFTSDRAHNSVLFAPLDELWRLTAGPDFIVAGTGPGSYTGIRVGIAAATGLSLARGVPLIGLASLCSLPPSSGLPRAVCGDARRGAWWWAELAGSQLTFPPVSGTLEEIAARAAAWDGEILTPDPASPPFCQARPSVPEAALLAAAAAALAPEERARLATITPEPLYLTAPFVTVSRKPVFL